MPRRLEERNPRRRSGRRRSGRSVFDYLMIHLAVMVGVLLLLHWWLPGPANDEASPWNWSDAAIGLLAIPCILFNLGLFLCGLMFALAAVCETFALIRAAATAQPGRREHWTAVWGWLLAAVVCLGPVYALAGLLLRRGERWTWAELGLASLPIDVFLGAGVACWAYAGALRKLDLYRRKRLTLVEQRLATSDGRRARRDLNYIASLLVRGDASLSAAAFGGLSTVVQLRPGLRGLLETRRSAIQSVLLHQFGFLQAAVATNTAATMHGATTTSETQATESSAEKPTSAQSAAGWTRLVTLGAKVGAGTGGKRTAPPTASPEELARWVVEHRGPRARELQISIGYDLGRLPAQEQRAKFIASYLFVASTDLASFQSLIPRPRRDHGAAYGLLIRGEVVEARFPGQGPGRRLDYILPVHPHASQSQLAALARQVQLLNLGLLAAAPLDAHQACFPDERPTGFDPRLHGAAEAYRAFEQQWVRLLREYDSFRDPDKIHPLDPEDHAQRRRAFAAHRLDECLYPQFDWLTPLYGDNHEWEALLPVLRSLEAMLLHQGAYPDAASGDSSTLGARFIREARALGRESADRIESILAGRPWRVTSPSSCDPLLDPDDPHATLAYVTSASRAMLAGRLDLRKLPDVSSFRRHCSPLGLASPWPEDAL